MAKAKSEQVGPIGTGMQFLSDCQSELKKVSRPSKDETIKATIVVVVMVSFIALVLSIFDILFNRLMTVILS